MIIPSVGVGDVAVMVLFPSELIYDIFAGSSVESSEHGVGMDNTGFSRRGDWSRSGPALKSDAGDG